MVPQASTYHSYLHQSHPGSSPEGYSDAQGVDTPHCRISADLGSRGSLRLVTQGGQ